MTVIRQQVDQSRVRERRVHEFVEVDEPLPARMKGVFDFNGTGVGLLEPGNLVLHQTGSRPQKWRDCKTCHRTRELARVHATPGLLDEKARQAREWRIENSEKARLADARGVARRRERNRLKRSALMPRL